MNRHVNAIAGRLSLRASQRCSLEILDRITEIASLEKDADIQTVLDAIRSQMLAVGLRARPFSWPAFLSRLFKERNV